MEHAQSGAQRAWHQHWTRQQQTVAPAHWPLTTDDRVTSVLVDTHSETQRQSCMRVVSRARATSDVIMTSQLMTLMTLLLMLMTLTSCQNEYEDYSNFGQST